jgi:RNA polymerase sigma-B factor
MTASTPVDPSRSDAAASDDPSVTREQARAEELELFREYRANGSRRLRNELVERNMGLVEPHIRRFDGRGLALEDLRQVALLAVLKAVERFDPDMGVAFSTFAGRTIDGELKRLLRDRSWSVRPPRRQQEAFLAVRKTEDELIQSLGRSPTVSELAAATGESVDAVLEALEAGGARRAASLDQPSPGGTRTPADRLGAGDPSMGQVEVRVLVTNLLNRLDERERQVIELRFFEDLGQPEIAARLGLSQSYVSRLIRRILASMRDELDDASAVDDLATDI